MIYSNGEYEQFFSNPGNNFVVLITKLLNTVACALKGNRDDNPVPD